MKILAIDIGGTAIKYGTVLGDYTIEQAFEIPTEAHLGGPHLMHKIMGIVDTYAAEVDCVGISTAGQVNSELGKIIFASENIPKSITCRSASKMTSTPPLPRKPNSAQGAVIVIFCV